ncbi:hypothetical protein UF75_2735 [Desulfosporosinus sp. I2]|nr:hypothetical protein UF75_2735 [Desulfosporosinus sp. I2]
MGFSGSGLGENIINFYLKRGKGKMVPTGVMTIEDEHQAKAVEEQS